MGCLRDVSFPQSKRVVLRGAAAAALCAGLMLGWASPSQAAEKSIWGHVGELAGGGSAFELYRRLGVDTVQFHLNFAQVAPTEPYDPRSPADPAYRWPAYLDEAVEEGSRTGIRIAVQVSQSPRWANGGRPVMWRPRTPAFTGFLAAAARRYPTVRRWMIWGEPNRAPAFRPNETGENVGPRSYARLLDASYAALKAASPANIVIGGMTYTGGATATLNPRQWLHKMRLPNGKPPRLDWYGHNPFSNRYPDLRDRALPGGSRDIGDLDLFSREVARVYTRPCGPAGQRCGRVPKLWLSEYVIQSDHGSGTFNTFVSRKGQAEWLTAAFRAANSLPSVAGLGWLAVQDDSESSLGRNFGLVTATGVRKPSFYTFRRAPSRAFRPGVEVRRSIRLGGAASEEGISVRVGARSAGRITVTLTRRGQQIARASAVVRVSSSGRLLTLRAADLMRGAHTLTVDAPRGERVVRTISVR